MIRRRISDIPSYSETIRASPPESGRRYPAEGSLGRTARDRVTVSATYRPGRSIFYCLGRLVRRRKPRGRSGAPVDDGINAETAPAACRLHLAPGRPRQSPNPPAAV